MTEPPAKEEVPGALAELRAADALLSGHFRLTSGLHSDTYLQCALVMRDPARAERILRPLSRQWASSGVTLVLGPAVGGILIAYELSRHLRAQAIYCEREEGQMRLRRGFQIRPDDAVLLAEDVITTGGSLREAGSLAAAAGARVVGVASLVDRTGGSQKDLAIRAAIRLTPPTYRPEDCPLCGQGTPLETPGSRHLAK